MARKKSPSEVTTATFETPPRQLPQEIWWIACRELTDQRDFDALFNSALVSRGIASIALPLLYR